MRKMLKKTVSFSFKIEMKDSGDEEPTTEAMFEVIAG